MSRRAHTSREDGLRFTKHKVAARAALLSGLVAALLSTAIAPAGADVTAGAGTGYGGDYTTPDEPLTGPCPGGGIGGELTGYSLEIVNKGTYSGFAGNSLTGPVSYVGETRVVITTGGHWISPVGTHPTNNCTLPGPIPITSVSVNDIPGGVDTPPGGDVTCTGNSGTFVRVSEAVVITFTATCTVKGNVPGASGTTNATQVTHVLEGTLTPCDIPVPPTPVTVPNPACDPPLFPPPGFSALSDSDIGAIYVGTYEAVGL